MAKIRDTRLDLADEITTMLQGYVLTSTYTPAMTAVQTSIANEITRATGVEAGLQTSLDGKVNLVSATTQTLNSDIAFALGKKIYSTDTNGTLHDLISHNVYQTGEQTEVGSETDALCLNHNAKGFDGNLPADIHISVNGKDLSGASFTAKVAYMEDVESITNSIDQSGGISSVAYVDQSIAAAISSTLLGMPLYGRTLTATAFPTVDVLTNSDAFDFQSNTWYNFDGTDWNPGTPLTIQNGSQIIVLEMLDGTSKTGTAMVGLKATAVRVNNAWEFAVDSSSASPVLLDNETLIARVADGAIEVAPQTMTVTPDSNPFTSGLALTFLTGFWQQVLNKINGLFGITSANSGAIAGEITRATNVESSLQANITTEGSRATGVENTIAGNLSAEITRATTAEGNLMPIAGGTFTGLVSGVTPTASANLATKGYVDSVAVLPPMVESIVANATSGVVTVVFTKTPTTKSFNTLSTGNAINGTWSGSGTNFTFTPSTPSNITNGNWTWRIS